MGNGGITPYDGCFADDQYSRQPPRVLRRRGPRVPPLPRSVSRSAHAYPRGRCLLMPRTSRWSSRVPRSSPLGLAILLLTLWLCWPGASACKPARPSKNIRDKVVQEYRAPAPPSTTQPSARCRVSAAFSLCSCRASWPICGRRDTRRHSAYSPRTVPRPSVSRRRTGNARLVCRQWCTCRGGRVFFCIDYESQFVDVMHPTR